MVKQYVLSHTAFAMMTCLREEQASLALQTDFNVMVSVKIHWMQAKLLKFNGAFQLACWENCCGK